jgi:predicted flap endonuclease-1-like 5' DNA nuclease
VKFLCGSLFFQHPYSRQIFMLLTKYFFTVKVCALPWTKLYFMPYKVIDIEGIGQNYAEKLNGLGIFTTSDLLEKGGNKKGRESIASKTGIPESLVLTWVNHADLMRINGIAGQYSELLEAAGVDTVKEFATRNAENLHVKLVETNEKFGLSGKVPSLDSLKDMIRQAKTLKSTVSH